MHFLDDSLLPENQQKLVIQVAPYGPQWLPGDFPEDIPVSFAEQVQKAVDCYNAGATVLHVHCREPDGKGSKRLSVFNEMLERLRTAVPKMVLQVGGSISFAPEGEGAEAKWLSDDTRHMLADLQPKPDQVTIAINTNQMNVTELLMEGDCDGTSLTNPAYFAAYRDMQIEAGPKFYLEHLKRLQANGIQPHFMLAHIAQLETVERLIRRGIYKGPLILNYVGIGGGASGTASGRSSGICSQNARRRRADDRRHHALRHPDEHDRDCTRTARARRDRGQYLAAQGRAHDLGAADRADGASRPRGRSRRRERTGGARHLPDRRAVQLDRGNARQARHGAEPRAWPARLPGPGRGVIRR